MAAEDSKRRRNQIQTEGNYKRLEITNCIFVKAKSEKALEEGR